jgi:uncharacterized coiled-coil DUF342 family protein
VSAGDEEALRAELNATIAALADERGRRIALSRELRVLADSLAEARSTALENELAARAARFRNVAEAEARLAAESQLAEERQWLHASQEQLREICGSKAFRYLRAVGTIRRRARLGNRSSA